MLADGIIVQVNREVPVIVSGLLAGRSMDRSTDGDQGSQ
jgi:hypothetical protein